MPKKTTLNFKPARLQVGREFLIVYYALNPASGKLERKKIRLNHIKDSKLQLRYAKQLITELNDKLFDGWSPFDDEFSQKEKEYFHDVLEVFLKRKKMELRNDSIRSYQSYCNMVSNWCNMTKRNEMKCFEWTKTMAIQYMDFVLEKGISNRTYNNYLVFMQGLFAWMIERKHINSNPFMELKKMKSEVKEREPIPVDLRIKIMNELENKDYNYLIACMLVFHALIRPKEITMLKPKSFNLKKQIIVIPGSVAKNGKERIATIPDSFMPYLASWNFNDAANDQYIFGRDFKAGAEPVNARRLSKKWDNLRNQLKFPPKYKLYSLRDSGIIQLLNDGVSPEEVMKQADHSSLDITTIYAKHVNPEGSIQIKEKGSKF